MLGDRATMTSLEDWSLSTLSSQIFRQQTQLQLRSGNSKFFGGRPSWKATRPTGLQLRSGNLRLGGGPSWKATGLQLQSLVCLVADEGDSYNCYLGTRVLGGRPSWKMGYNCNLGTRGFLWWLGWPCSTAMWDLGFLGGGRLRITCHWPCPPCCPASQCMSSCIALLSPEVRWSEMEWHVSLV